MPMGIGLRLAIDNGDGVSGGIISSIFADGTDGFYFDFSKTDQLFQDLVGTPADGAGENIGLGLESHAWGFRTYAQELEAQTNLVTNGDFAVDTAGWTGYSFNGSGHVSDASVTTAVAGRMRITAATGKTFPVSVWSLGLTIGSRYLLTLNASANDRNGGVNGLYVRIGTDSSGGNFGTVLNDNSGTLGARTYSFVATATLMYLTLFNNSGTVGSYTEYDNVSLKQVPGNHGLQATTTAQPKWQTGGLARFDGSDDNLLTTLLLADGPTTLLVKAVPNSASAVRIALGTAGLLANRCFLGFNASGNVAGGVGSESTGVIKGSVNRNGTVCVSGLVVDASNWFLYEQGAQTATGAKSAALNTTNPVAVGGTNATGGVSAFLGGDLYYALAIKKALTASDIATITNFWGTS